MKKITFFHTGAIEPFPWYSLKPIATTRGKCFTEPPSRHPSWGGPFENPKKGRLPLPALQFRIQGKGLIPKDRASCSTFK
jgi:hypothetical protein